LKLPTKEGRAEELTKLAFLHAPDELMPTWWTRLPVRAPVLVGWAGGPRAEELSAEGGRFIFDQALESLSGILGVGRKRVEGLLEETYTHDWRSDPLSRGAYSYVPVGSLQAQATLARPVGDRLFFAGEATNTEGHCGTVHGAIASGFRAAREVIKSRSR
jgi:monoamine oxidase